LLYQRLPGYTAMAAHILADLSFDAASRGQWSDGITLGEAAQRHAVRSPAGVQASVESRLAYVRYAGDRNWPRAALKQVEYAGGRQGIDRAVNVGDVGW
jgi:hypothetical protein